MLTGKIEAICVSEKKGTAKAVVEQARVIACHGIEGDAHAGNWHRQVSFLSSDKVSEFEERGGANVAAGAFGENILVRGIDFKTLPVGTMITAGGASFVITQIGKECHDRCRIYKTMGDCIMPREGVFAVALSGGVIQTGDAVRVHSAHSSTVDGEPLSIAPYRVAVITLSDGCSSGEREDESGRVAAQIAAAAGFSVVERLLLPDERILIEAALVRIADCGTADLILTTGGTGFAERDITPEATLSVSERLASGITEAMRFYGLSKTKKAMLSRAVSVIRKKTLIVNLPGSPKAVRENMEAVIEEIKHGIDILKGSVTLHGAK